MAGHRPVFDLGGRSLIMTMSGMPRPGPGFDAGGDAGPGRCAGSGSVRGAARRGLGRTATGRSSRATPTSSDRRGTRCATARAISSGDHHSSSHSSTWAARRGQAKLRGLRSPSPLPGPTMRPPRPIAAASPVGGDLPRHRRNRSALVPLRPIRVACGRTPVRRFVPENLVGRRARRRVSRAGDADDLAPAHGDDRHARAGAHRVDLHPAAEVDRHVADGRVVEEQVARLGSTHSRRAATLAYCARD